MFFLVSSAFLSFLFGFAFPPLWILTFLSVRGIVRLGREVHFVKHLATENARTKMYLEWSK